MHDCAEDEITLRDLYLILRRRATLILGLPLVLAALAFTVSKLMPPTYEAEAVLSLSEARYATALVEGLKARIETEAFARRLGEQRKVDWAKVQFDAKKGYLKLVAKGQSPEEAKKRASALAKIAFEDFRAAAFESKRLELEGEKEQLRAELLALESQRESLRKSLREDFAGRRTGASGTAKAVLEAAGVDPLVAGSPDPARTYLELELAKIEATLSEKRARLKQIEALLKDEEALAKLVENDLPLRLVAPPGLPLEPVAPRTLLNTAIAFFLGFFLAVFWAFLQAALEPPKEGEVAESPLPVSG